MEVFWSHEHGGTNIYSVYQIILLEFGILITRIVYTGVQKTIMCTETYIARNNLILQAFITKL